MTDDYLSEILTGHGVKHRIAEILWGGGMTAQEALWQAEQVVEILGLRYEFENGRVMYTTKPAACKANGHWKVCIASPHTLYEGEE